MNILLIAYYYNQLGCGGVERPRSLVRHFTAAGHRVTVLTAGYQGDRLDGPEAIVFDPSRSWDRRGLNYCHWLGRRLVVEAYLKLGFSSSLFTGWLKRAELSIPAILARFSPHVVLATYPTAENLLLGLHIHEHFGIPLVADFRDGLLFEPVERRALHHPAVRQSYEKLETRVAREAAAIVTVSPPISRYFQEKFGCHQVITIPNGYSADPSLIPLEPNPFAPERFHMVHTGSISLSDRGCNLAPLIQGVEMALADSPDLRRRLIIHFAGRLSLRERRLLRPLTAAGIARLYGSLPRETSLWMQGKADLLLLLTSPDRTSVATTKIFEYMHAEKPVLALAAGTFAAEIIAETGIGWTIPNDSPQNACAVLTAIMKGELPPPRPNELAIRRYDRKAQSDTYLSLLEQVRR